MPYFDDTPHKVVPGNIVYADDLNNPLAALNVGFESIVSDIQTGNKIKYGADTGTANAYIIDIDPAPSGYVDGMEVWLKPSSNNTGDSTINVSSLGAIQIKRPGGLSIKADDLRAGSYFKLKYNGGFFQIVSSYVYPDNVVAEIESMKSDVEAAKSAVAADKDKVHSDRLVVEAIVGDIPDISTATPGQVLVVNDAKSGYDFSWVGLGQMPSGVEMEGSFVGGDYWNGTDSANDIDITQFIFPSHDNTNIIASTATITGATDATGANGMLGGAKQANDVLDIWALKGTSGVCIGFTRNVSETITGVTLPSGYADAYKWIGTTGKLNVTDLPKIVCVGDEFSYLNSAEAVFYSGGFTTAYASYFLSGVLPDDRYKSCRIGVTPSNSTAISLYISSDGINEYYMITWNSASDRFWGRSDWQPSGYVPINGNTVYIKGDSSTTTAHGFAMQTAKLRR